MVLLAKVRESAGALDMDAAAAGKAACDSPWEVARRLGLGGGVCLWLSEASRGAGPNAEQKALLRKTRCVVGPFALEQADAVREWLNEGAHHAVISLDGAAPLDVSLDAAIARGTTGLPAERLVLLLPVGPLGDPATLATLLQDLEQVAARKGSGCLECAAPETVGAVGGVLLTLAPDAAHEAEEDKLIQAVAPFARCARTLRVAHSARAHARRALCPVAPSAPIAPSALCRSNDRLRVWVSGLHGTRAASAGAAAKVGELHALAIDVLAPACLGGGGEGEGGGGGGAGLLELGACVGSCARTDRADGLMTTVVCDEGGVALGLVYSSRASLCAAVEAGRGVYHSRSKGGLWRKGDTSGAYQTLLRIDLDCDHDAIRFTVSTRSTRARSYARGGGGRWAEGGST